MKALILLLLSILTITSAQEPSTREQIIVATHGNQLPNPFLSTTLSTKITSVSSNFDFDSVRKSIFGETLTRFLTKIFTDQQVYDVKIISVNIFDDHVLKIGDREVEYSTYKSENGKQIVSFSIVVSAEYTQEAQELASGSFGKMLMHVTDKFQSHLIKYMKDTGDPFFLNVESVVLADFERIHVTGNTESGQTTSDAEVTNNQNEVLGMSEETLNTASIVAIVVGSITLVVLIFASVKYYRKEKKLQAYLRTAEMGASNRLVDDDYSFDPLGSGNNGSVATSVRPYADYRDHPSAHSKSSVREDEIAFSDVWPDSAPGANTLFPAPGTTTVAKATLSYTEELNKLPKQHVFAPPGKIGVAVDVYNGQPVVHKVRKDSPLQNMLRPNDIIVAIDDEDTSCLSAADVTKMMCQRMDRVRKITFIRRG